MIPLENRLVHIKLLAQVQLNYISDLKLILRIETSLQEHLRTFLITLLLNLAKLKKSISITQ